MKPGLMCLFLIIYFVHGLEIPSENFLYHFLQSPANGYPENRYTLVGCCAVGISALCYVLDWGQSLHAYSFHFFFCILPSASLLTRENISKLLELSENCGKAVLSL